MCVVQINNQLVRMVDQSAAGDVRSAGAGPSSHTRSERMRMCLVVENKVGHSRPVVCCSSLVSYNIVATYTLLCMRTGTTERRMILFLATLMLR